MEHFNFNIVPFLFDIKKIPPNMIINIKYYIEKYIIILKIVII